MLIFAGSACQTCAIIVAGNGLVLTVAQISGFTSSPTVAWIVKISKISTDILTNNKTLGYLSYKCIQFVGIFH